MEGDDKFIDKYRIDSTRLPGWNYGDDGYYFVTICTHERVCYFGDVLMDNDGEYSVGLSPIGKIVRDELSNTPRIRMNVKLDAWIIMPNHIHAIIVIDNERGDSDVHRAFPGRDVARNVSTNKHPTRVDIRHASPTERKQWMADISPGAASLPTIVRAFKSAVTKQCNESGYKFKWQPRFYDRIIRTERALYAVRYYIEANPKNWERDRNNPENLLM